MMKQRLIFVLLVSAMIFSCGNASSGSDEKNKKVEISTKYGNMVVMLYNETPKHRDNFIKLVKEGFYDDLLFHRVIKDFMIQGGDPDSKDAPSKKMLGGGGPGYKVPAEFNEKYYHKKGALAAARQPDRVNPKKESSGSQFYIVHGKVLNKKQLTNFEDQKKFKAIRDEVMKLYKEKAEEINALRSAGNQDSLNNYMIALQEKAEEIINPKQFKLDSAQVNDYITIGGTPHLDGSYTVFGEVIEGLEIIDSIANAKTGQADRPIEDIIMEMKIVE